jgi:hypothetical protein
MSPRSSTAWEDRAAAWLARAREPSHDAYRYDRDAFFALQPPPGGPALEVGCGEARVRGDLRARGYDVCGPVTAPTLVEAAREAGPGGLFLLWWALEP